MTITQADAQPGDILYDTAGMVWQRGAEEFQWSNLEGLYGYYGEWDPMTMGPQGELVLLVRGGKPVTAA